MTVAVGMLIPILVFARIWLCVMDVPRGLARFRDGLLRLPPDVCQQVNSHPSKGVYAAIAVCIPI